MEGGGPRPALFHRFVPLSFGALRPPFPPPPCFRAHVQKGLVLSEVFSHEVSILGRKVDRERLRGLQGSGQIEVRIVPEAPIVSEKIRKVVGIEPRERDRSEEHTSELQSQSN